jgi:tetratricopeptide (TPR) repeat protein
VLHGSVLDDSFSGELRLCLAGNSCVAKEAFITALLVVNGSSDRMAGAVERGAEACHAQVPDKGGVTLRKMGAKGEHPKPKPAPAPEKEQAAREIMRDAAQYMQEGSFEKARKRFNEAIAIVPLPEAYNGIGVTYFARGDSKEALKAYRQAVDVDPNFGDSYYNMACLYAKSDKKDLAFKYLKMSMANGYAEVAAMQDDHDLDPLRQDPRFEKVLKEASKRAAKP